MAKGKPGRPSLYTPELAQEICDRLSKGEPLSVICRSPGMPDPATVWRWTEADGAFSQAIAQARARGFDAIADQCFMIANTQTVGERVEMDANGKVERVIREDMLGHRKLQIETRLKLLAKWDPKRYGERLDLNHSGGLTIARTGLTDAELEVIASGGSEGAAGKKEGEGQP